MEKLARRINFLAKSFCWSAFRDFSSLIRIIYVRATKILSLFPRPNMTCISKLAHTKHQQKSPFHSVLEALVGQSIVTRTKKALEISKTYCNNFLCVVKVGWVSETNSLSERCIFFYFLFYLFIYFFADGVDGFFLFVT